MRPEFYETNEKAKQELSGIAEPDALSSCTSGSSFARQPKEGRIALR